MKKMICLIIFSSLFLSGCSGNLVFKDAKLPTVMGIEKKEGEEKLHSTFIIHTPIGTSQGLQESATEIISSDGKNISELFSNVESKASGGVDLSKLSVSVLSEDYAKTNFEEYINRLIFAQRTSSVGQIILVEGKPSDALAIRETKVPLVDDYVSELIKSGIAQNFIPETNVAKVHRTMHDEGKDNIIPVYKVSKQKNLWRHTGVALMDGTSYSGARLGQVKTELLMAFMKDAGKSFWEINEGELEGDAFIIKNIKLDKNFGQIDENGQIEVDLKLKLGVMYRSFNDATITGLDESVKKQEDILSEMYTGIAEETFAELKEANCDALGIGRDLIAYHPETWKQISGKNYYKNVTVKPVVEISILKSN